MMVLMTMIMMRTHTHALAAFQSGTPDTMMVGDKGQVVKADSALACISEHVQVQARLLESLAKQLRDSRMRCVQTDVRGARN